MQRLGARGPLQDTASMNLFRMASRGVDLGALPEDDAPRALIDFGPSAGPVVRGSVPAEMNDLFEAAASEYGVDPTILKGIAYAESRFRPDIISGQVTSPAGAVGLMQFMPATAKEMGINPLDPVESVFGAAAYLRQSLDKFGGDTERAIASYNWGRNRSAFEREDWFKSLPEETRNYVGTVLEFADGLAPATTAGGKVVPLPDGVAPSAAGGGRGSVNPPAAIAPQERRDVPGMSVGTVLQDVASGALQIGPTAVKGVADLARLVSGDNVGKGLSDAMEEGIKAIQGTVGSERAAAQRENFQRDMADPNVGIGQALANNKGALADQVLPTLGSMLLPVGVAGVAGKAATVGKTAAALDAVALASRVATAQRAAGIGATAAQNAADVFAGLVDKGYSLEDAYKAAGITVPFSVIAGKLTGGGAEVALAQQAAGQAVKSGAAAVLKGAAREGAQEVGEELGQVTGEAVGTGVTPDLTNAGKRLAVAGTLGAVVGGGVDVAGQVGAQDAAIVPPKVEEQPTVPTAPTTAGPSAATDAQPSVPAVAAPDGAAWSDVAAAEKRARAEAEVARKLAEADGNPAPAQGAVSPDAVPQAPASELAAPVGDVARQLLAGGETPAAAAKNEAPATTVEQAEQQLAAREAPVEMQMRPTGTLLVKGDVPALRERLAAAGVDNTIAVQGGLVVSRSQAAQAQQALSTTAPAQQPPAATQQEAANVPQTQAPATQPAAEAAQATASDITSTVAPVPAPGVSAAGGTATAQADGVSDSATQNAKTPVDILPPGVIPRPSDQATGKFSVTNDPADISEAAPGVSQALGDQLAVGSDGIVPQQGRAEEGAEIQYSRAPGYNAAVDAAITAGMKGEAPGRQPVAIGDTTAAMQAAGIPAGELRTSPVILTKALFDHGVTKPVLKQIPDLLENPVMVFSSASVDGSYVVVTSEMVRGQPLIVAVSPEETRGGVAFNFVPSLYPKDDLGALQRWMNSGLLRYIDQKQSPSWFGSTRLQLPGEYRTARGLQKASVATEADVVKNGGDASPAGPEIQQSREMSPELARMLMAMGRPAGMATKDSVRAAVSELVNGVGLLPNGLGRVVVATSDEIKTEWEPLIGPTGMEASGDLGQAQGFYDPRTKTVFVIADHIRQGDELGVVAHELMHKHGQAVLGEEGWNKLHAVIGTWASADQATMERRVHDEARARVEASRPEGADADNYSTQELFPYAVQVALEAGVKPSLAAPQGTVARWLGQVRAALRQIWSKVTGKPGQFEAQDLVNLAFGIAQRENPAHRGELDEVRTGRKGLAAVSARKYPATMNVDTVVSTLHPNARGDGGNGVIVLTPSETGNPGESAPMFSRANPGETPPLAASDRELTPIPEETRARRVQRAVQDKFNRITVLRNWAKENDIELSPESDVWGYEARMHGTVATKVEDFREQTVKPLIERIQKAGYSMGQVAEYLHAKHAQERNAQIESIDPSIKDGSGMTNEEAQAILAKAPEELVPLAAEVQAITGNTRQILLDAGIISQEMADAWDAAYRNYVPLKGGDEKKQGGTGKGLSVDGRQKRALGHGARDEKIVENILRDHERAIMLAEKNKVGQSLLVLVDELNNPDIATIGQPEKRRVLKQGSMFEARTPDGIVVDSFATQQQALNFVATRPDMKMGVHKVSADPMVVSMASPMLGPNEVQVYLKGHAVRLQLNDELLSRAYQNLGPENFTAMMKINREVNATLSKAYTGLNPEFLLKNIARDFTAGLTITTAKYGAGVAARAVKNYPKAMAQLLRYGFTKKSSPSLMSYRLAGGSTGAAYLSDLQRIGEDVQATFDDARGIVATAKADGAWRGSRSLTRKALKFGLKYIEILNAAGESAMRLSVFEAMRETGHDVRESASAAKELMNFNRQGEATRTVGGWYLFLNASIQGTAAVADALVHGQKRGQGWAMVAGMASLFYALASMQFGDDDEGKKAWERISQDVKSKNLIIRTGQDSYVTLPMPYGLGAFFGIGNAAYDLQRGDDIDKVALRLTLNFADHFLPVKPYAEGGDTRGLVELVPGVAGGELMRAALRAGVNRSGLGGDIVPDSKFDESRPDHLRAYRSTKTSVYQTIADQLNAATGGTQTQAGLVDVSPETLKYWTRTLTGGAGAFLADTLSMLKLGKDAALNPDDPDRAALVPEIAEMPVIRGFVRNDQVGDDRRQYWQAAKEIARAQQDSQRAKKAGDEAGLQRVEDQRGELLYLVKTMERNSKWIREIRDEVEEVMLDESTSMAFKRAAVKKLEAEESSIYREFIDTVTEDRAEAAKERSSGGK